jgi:signal recognition particle receptor subunit beta
MVLFNYATKEITAKIVYYGPGLCGKTTNLQFIYDSLPSNNKSKMLSLATKTDRTLFFDFLPLDLGKIRGMRTKLQLYTVPGQVYYNSTRQLVLKGADGVVFVADSQDFALDANQESLQNLEDNLKRQGIRIAEIPVVMQYNKRDLPNALPIAELEATVNKRLKVPSFESVATTGIGVEQTLKGITQLVLNHLIKKYGLEGSEPLDIQVLNANVASDGGGEETETLWADDASGGSPGKTATIVDEDDDESIPLVATELVTPVSSSMSSMASSSSPMVTAPPSPFDDLLERFSGSVETPAPLPKPATVQQQAGEPAIPTVVDVPNPFASLPPQRPAAPPPPPQPPVQQISSTASVEIPLPANVLSSLPVMENTTGRPDERRSADGLVREVTLPLNLSLEELKRHRKLKLKITIDVNLLP